MHFKEIINEHLKLNKIKMNTDHVLCDKLIAPLSGIRSGDFIIIAGYSGSGKTNLNINLLSNKSWKGKKQSLKGCFHNMYICSPSLHTLKDNIFEDIDDEYKTDSLTHDFLDFIIEDTDRQIEEQEDEPELNLVCFDDIGDEIRADKKLETKLNKIISNRRHRNITIILILQQLKQAPPKARSNMSHLITFKPKSVAEQETVYEYFGKPKKHMHEIFNYFFKEPHDFCWIDCSLRDTGNFKFYRNYNQIELSE
jgi:hypothetical protein